MKRESKKFNLGLGLGPEFNIISIDKSPNFITSDTILQINPTGSAGFVFQFLLHFNLNKHWTLRSSFPNFNYAAYSIDYTLKYNRVDKSFYNFDYYKLGVPIDIIFKSDNINNFKFYVLGGIYYSYNFTNNTDSKKVNFLRLSKYDYGISTGIGFLFDGDLTVYNIEFKYQYSLSSMFIQDPDFIFSNNLNTLQSHNFIILFNFL